MDPSGAEGEGGDGGGGFFSDIGTAISNWWNGNTDPDPLNPGTVGFKENFNFLWGNSVSSPSTGLSDMGGNNTASVGKGSSGNSDKAVGNAFSKNINAPNSSNNGTIDAPTSRGPAFDFFTAWREGNKQVSLLKDFNPSAPYLKELWISNEVLLSFCDDFYICTSNILYRTGISDNPPYDASGNWVNDIRLINAAVNMSAYLDGAQLISEAKSIFSLCTSEGIIANSEVTWIRNLEVDVVTKIEGNFTLSSHAITRVEGRSVSLYAINDALKNPLKITKIRFDNLGRPSLRYIGKSATVAVNPETKVIVSVNPTSSQLRNSLMKGK